MNEQHTNTFPKLHHAMWPGLVGKGSPGAEPSLDLDTMLDLTARAEVDGVKFDGVDLFLSDPHISIDLDDEGIERLADKIRSKGFMVGSVVAPVWPPTGGGSAMGSEEERRRFVEQVRKACRIASRLRQLGARPHGIVRIDSACGVGDWASDPQGNQARIAQTFRESCSVAEGFGERLAAEGEICWGGMHSWRHMVDLLERVDRPQTLGFQADMAHTLLYLLGFNAPEDALLPPDWDWSDPAKLDAALGHLTAALRPWTLDFHVAQNDATVKGSGTHDKTGHHCLPTDPNGKLNIPHHAGFWLRIPADEPTRAFRHICWDGCMFPNAVMSQPETWNSILRAMLAVRDAHGWSEPAPARPEVVTEPVILKSQPSPRRLASKPVRAARPKRAVKRRKPARPTRRPASAKRVPKVKRLIARKVKKASVKRRRGKVVKRAGGKRRKTKR